MILVDSSAWIGLLRNDATPAATKLLRLIETVSYDIVVGDLVLLEVLQGARDHAHAARMERNLRRFKPATLLDPALAIHAARNYRTLRGLGITLRKTVDLIIGTFCIEGGHILLHQDRDFTPMAQHLGLKLA